ncbi:MAG TPA: glycosyltransferase family 4 protein [Pyrinomonadaceae bacterium]|nr:glycosyltransferase family 4 protein [Pyrinomonadaceae bacterium]
MRVLVGMPDKDSLGGPIYCEPPFVAALRASGVEVDEETYVYGGSADQTPLLKRIKRVIDAAQRLRQRTRENRYDIIHLNTSIDEKCVVRDLVTLAFLPAKVPVYLKMHGSIARFLATKNPVWRWAMGRLFARVAGIGVLSGEERENFIRAGCPPEKLTLAKLVVEGDIYTPDPGFRTRQGVGSDTPILLYSGRFVEAKGLLDVIAACGELNRAGREFALFCLGDGPVRAKAESLAAELDIAESVRFFGYIPESETAAFHANSTAFVFPTYHDEGLPIVILKSIAAGLPIITTRIRGAADYMTDPENCLWTEPRNPTALAERITKLLDNPDLRQKMSTNNNHLATQFTAKSVAAEYTALYRSIIER